MVEHAARIASTIRLATRWALGLRTIRIPERRQNRLVMSRRGLIQPRGPAIAMMAGSRVTAAMHATAIEIAIDGPTVEKIGIFARIIATNVTATVAADGVITLPIDVKARLTASSESSPSRT